MEGYIIESVDGTFLAQNLFWFKHGKPEEAWVHPPNILDYLRKHSGSWDVKPAKAYPACYQPRNAQITGETIRLEF